MKPTPSQIRQALQCPPARGWRKSRPNIPPNMIQRMAATESAAWSHSPAAGKLWESGLSLGAAIAAANELKVAPSAPPD